MAVKTLHAIKQETGRDLTNQTADTTLVFAELANGTAGAATVEEITKNCLKEIPDDVLTTSDVVDTVASGDMSPVTSNGVADAIAGNIKTREIDYGDVSITGNNYLKLWETQDNIEIISVALLYWSQNTGAFSVMPYLNSQVYLLGNVGVTIKSLKIKIFYRDL